MEINNTNTLLSKNFCRVTLKMEIPITQIVTRTKINIFQRNATFNGTLASNILELTEIR